MKGWVKLIATLTLLLYSIIGQQVAEHVSHAHLMIGSVTPEQLRAHEAEEEREGWPLAVSYPSDNGAAVQGGLIVSLLFGPDASRIPVVLDRGLVVPMLVSTIGSSVSFPRLPRRSLAQSPLDPPPRSIFKSA